MVLKITWMTKTIWSYYSKKRSVKQWLSAIPRPIIEPELLSREYECIRAAEASAIVSFSNDCNDAHSNCIVLDTIAEFDGLERLFVIPVGLDAPIEADGSSCSPIYRAITRAHMMVSVVDRKVRGGWLEFLQVIEFEDGEFDQDRVAECCDGTAARAAEVRKKSARRSRGTNSQEKHQQKQADDCAETETEVPAAVTSAQEGDTLSKLKTQQRIWRTSNVTPQSEHLQPGFMPIMTLPTERAGHVKVISYDKETQILTVKDAEAKVVCYQNVDAFIAKEFQYIAGNSPNDGLTTDQYYDMHIIDDYVESAATEIDKERAQRQQALEQRQQQVLESIKSMQGSLVPLQQLIDQEKQNDCFKVTSAAAVNAAVEALCSTKQIKLVRHGSKEGYVAAEFEGKLEAAKGEDLQAERDEDLLDDGECSTLEEEEGDDQAELEKMLEQLELDMQDKWKPYDLRKLFTEHNYLLENFENSEDFCEYMEAFGYEKFLLTKEDGKHFVILRDHYILE